MRNTVLEFEQPLAELENKIEELRYVQTNSAVDISDEVARLQQKSQALAKGIYSKLTPWQTALVARHPQRPYTFDYVRTIFTDFHEMHGDRMYADDLSIVGGLARFHGTRSEEHTSELQSLMRISYAVFCLKKKNKKKIIEKT